MFSPNFVHNSVLMEQITKWSIFSPCKMTNFACASSLCRHVYHSYHIHLQEPHKTHTYADLVSPLVSQNGDIINSLRCLPFPSIVRFLPQAPYAIKASVSFHSLGLWESLRMFCFWRSRMPFNLNFMFLFTVTCALWVFWKKPSEVSALHVTCVKGCLPQLSPGTRSWA